MSALEMTKLRVLTQLNQLTGDLESGVPSRFSRILTHPYLMPYNRLAVLVTFLNGLVAIYQPIGFKLAQTLTLINFAVAILIRQQEVVNGLFRIATSAPVTWPLSVRAALAKVYHFGGVHVGAFFCGTVWLAVSLSLGFPNSLVPLVCVHLLVLSVMIGVSLPFYRARHHNVFERVARFGGWLSLVFFWIEVLTLQGPKLSFETLTLSVLTLSIALPWLRLRKVPIELVRPSSHAALVRFDYGVTPFAGSSTELSRNPLLEWHSFANVPAPGVDGFRLTISRAGDWTGALIDDQPQHLWVKGIPMAGVGNIETLFRRVIWVATGSGIGPCLPHLFTSRVPSKLVWSTRDPRKTYGDDLVAEINRVQPDAVIWATDLQGKPDLVQLALKAYREFDAEAVICISNKKVTWNVVHELESRGIPAFGAIWDS